MTTLKGQHIYLRALEPEDLEFVYELENDTSIWEISQTQTPYSRFLIRQYLENAQQDIFEAKQLRLAICKNDSFEAIGLIDLFDFDPKNQRAGIGILIQHPNHRNQGYGHQAVALLIQYSFEVLALHQLYATISTDNHASIALFTTFGFQCVGIKKDWNFNKGQFSDEGLYQLISSS
ncbi:GNAT family N-acetyltransferase [Flavobacterium sp.]|uniref:GNAT family N-acetyltransferase n=1 Tax=Flavobacterium sp. TaxID=239 RepID=UPI002621B642|nr:GNAT family N-acetyltransferase [Flavobacterium sp.]MDD2986515.1 GNAT family N-acetyltransferase [Flavobacterium sp.]